MIHRSMLSFARLALIAVTALTSQACMGGDSGLVPPPGFFAAAEPSGKKARECVAMPKPYTESLEFPSKYEGSDKARDDLNEKAYAVYKDKTARINSLEKEVSASVESWLRSGQEPSLQCALNLLDGWAQAGALQSRTTDHTGRAVRKWALASYTAAWLRLKFSVSRPLEQYSEQARRIEAWFDRLTAIVIEDWSGQPEDKFNNHEYWAAWAVMASGVALDRRDYFDWAVAQYRRAASQVDAQGYLANELARDTRALAYHNYSLGPLVMIAAFAHANGTELMPEGHGALQRLATRVLLGVDDPDSFARRAGHAQNLSDLNEPSKFAWLEPYCWLSRCDATTSARMQLMRPLKTYRLGGNLTELFDSGYRIHLSERRAADGGPPRLAARHIRPRPPLS
ncbi:MAG: mannuronate-specific alginate lyase [Stagnimonas sp.]|nr:mannuronate-specific alginate lyase [Stagnimonas sp.]